MMGEQREIFQHTPYLPLGRELYEKREVGIEEPAQIFRVVQNPFSWGTNVTNLLENIFLLQNHLESGWHKPWEKQGNSAHSITSSPSSIPFALQAPWDIQATRRGSHCSTPVPKEQSSPS